MKWVWRIGAGVAALSLLAMVFVGVNVERRQRELAEREMPTEAELLAIVDDGAQSRELSLEVSVDTESLQSEADADRPNQLARTLSRDEIRKQFPTTRGVASSRGRHEMSFWELQRTRVARFYKGTLRPAALSFADSFVPIEDLDSDAHVPHAVRLIRSGDIEEGRGHLLQYRATESYELSKWRAMLGYLAWLEPDPEKAALMLEASCSGTDSELMDRLRNAVALCEATGSEALAEYYRERLERARESRR